MSSEMFSLAPSTEDLTLFGACMTCMVLSRYFLDVRENSVLRNLAVGLGGRQLKVKGKHVQCSESMFKVVFHVFTSVWAYVLVADKDWFYNTELCFIGHPHTDFGDGIRLFYMVQMSYAMQAILMHFFEPLRKDFLEMFLHHIVTIILIWLSWSNQLWRVGTLVLLVHDVSDVPLLIAKVFRYLNSSVGTNAFFGICVFSWPTLRMYLFPRYLAYTAVWGGQNIVDAKYTTVTTGLGCLLWILFGLHCFWYRLMLITLHKSIFKKVELDDIRSESEASGSEADEPNTPKTEKKKRK